MKRKLAIVSIALALNLAFPFELHGDSHVVKISGSNRVETSIESSKSVKSDTLVVASAYKFADALSAFNLASKYNAKLVLIGNNTDMTPLIEGIKKAYIVGGENSIGGSSTEALKSMVGNVERIAGTDRYDTNILTLEKAGFKKVGVADGRHFADALSASGLLKKEKLGLMLVDGSKPYSTDKEVEYTFGLSVKQDGGKRLGGKNRYSTSDIINDEFGKSNSLAVTTGEEFADALSAINIINSAKDNSILLLKNIDTTNKKILENSEDVFLIGGRLGDSVEKSILKLKDSNYEIKPIEKKIDKGLIISPPADADGNPIMPIQMAKKNHYLYYYCMVRDEGFSIFTRGVETSRIDVNKIRREVPKGYRVISGDEEMRAFKAGDQMWNNKVFIVKEGTKIIKTQEEYDRLIFEQLKHGSDHLVQNVVVSPKVKPSVGLNAIAQGMGYYIHQLRVCEGAINLKWTIRQAYYTKEVYDKEKYLENLQKVRKMVEKSGALRLKTDEERAELFAKYLIYNYPYNTDKDDHIRSRSPYSITDYETGVCEGFTYTFNQGMFMIGIPSYAYSGSDHMEAKFYTGEYWKVINTTGSEQNDVQKRYKNFRKLPESVLENTITSPAKDMYYTEKEVDKILYLYGIR